MNITRTLLQFVLLLLFCTACDTLSAQSYRRAYAPTDSYCRAFVETSDGGFLMVGGIETDSTLFLQRTAADGGIQWTRHQDLNGATGIAVVSAAAGGFALLCENYWDGNTLQSLLLKIDSAGNTEWQKVLDNSMLPNAYRDLVATSDGGYALAGNTRSFVPVSDFHIQLLKLDASGNTSWSKTVGDPNDGKELARRIAEMPNGDLVIAGERREASVSQDISDFFLARTDASGTAIWQQEYPKSGYQTAMDFQVDPNGNLILLGESKYINPVAITFLKTDGSGTELWYTQPLAKTDTVNLDISRLARCFTLDNAGSLYVPFLEATNLFQSDLLAVLKLNPDGDSVWTHTSDVTDLPYAALYTSDHKFAFAGNTGVGVAPLKATLMKGSWADNYNTFFSSISGTVFWDQDNDCTADSAESAPPRFIVEAENQFGDYLYQMVGPNGQYTFSVNAGDYTITTKPFPGTEALWQICDTPIVSVPPGNQSFQAPPIGVQSLADCPFLSVELSAGRIRRCTTVTYTAFFCNNGTQTATAASIQFVTDPLFTFVSSSIPLSTQNGDTLHFDVGNLQPGFCGELKIKLLLSCAAQQGDAFCAEAHIFPDSSCLPPDPQWDDSNVEVSASCNGDATFTISNTGTGNMAGTVDYVIIEDQILYMQGNLQLNAGVDTVITLSNPSGASYYLQASQRPGHPALSMPTAIVSMCNGNNGPNLALQLALGSSDPYFDTYCDQVVGSYDPNDKRGFPLGWRAEHYLELDQDIEYMIRFQNTGNDTAFLVVIRDTLPPEVDLASLRPGASSHPYTLQITEANSLEFTFGNILLPDSTTNEPESNGYVTFKVSQQPNLALGSLIENRAAIYFDFNEPIITNTYFHTIGQPLLTVTVDPPSVEGLQLQVYPNPAAEYIDFKVSESTGKAANQLQLFSTTGKRIRQVQFAGQQVRLYRNDLEPGLYFFQLIHANGKRASGKLILK